SREFDVQAIPREFPALHQQIHGHPLVYLDNAATTQKPQAVVDAVRHYYEHDNANVHGGVPELSVSATEADDEARRLVARCLGALVHIATALGAVNPVKEMIRIAHRRGVPALIDGAQAVAHMNVDVQDLDADFYAFSGHKLFGPTGIGILYGKLSLLEGLPP